MVRDLLPTLVGRHAIDLVVANGENASGGLGLGIKAAEELFNNGVDVLTSGNHIFRHKEIYDYLDRERRLIRPANYPSSAPGRGSVLVETAGGIKVGVVNVMGRTFMAPLDCPFETGAREVAALKGAGAQVIIVDIHAEATSEKMALGWHLDGSVGAVFGTHTHIQTADGTILPGGAAYMTDLGMTGPHLSVIGMKKEAVVSRFLTGLPTRFEVAKKGIRLEGAIFFLDPETGFGTNVERIQEVLPKIAD